MSQQTVLLGSGPNSGQGDNLYTAFQKINSNFNELYLNIVSTGTTVANLTANGTVKASVINANIGDIGALQVGSSLSIGVTNSPQQVFTPGGVSVGPCVRYTAGNGTVTIPNTCQYFLVDCTFTSLILNMPSGPISGQAVEISFVQASSGSGTPLTHEPSGSQTLHGALTTSTVIAGTGGKWVFYQDSNIPNGAWYRLDGAA
jgi:hypothetical protein